MCIREPRLDTVERSYRNTVTIDYFNIRFLILIRFCKTTVIDKKIVRMSNVNFHVHLAGLVYQLLSLDMPSHQLTYNKYITRIYRLYININSIIIGYLPKQHKKGK